MNISDFLSRLKKVRKQGSGWIACCPAHDDHRQSLSVAVGDDGRILSYCHAGCAFEAICESARIEQRECFADGQSHFAHNSNGHRQIAITSDYRDEDGTLLFQAVRFEPKGFSQRRPDGKGGWIWNLHSVRRVLYRLLELLSADPHATVFICEGEKDVDRLRSLGLVATTNPMGAGKWRDEYREPLRGREVVILPDKDQTGHDHAQTVARSLCGVAASVKILALPGLALKGDVSDWLDAGGDAEQLCVLAENAAEWTPESESKIEPTDDAPPLLHTWGEFDDLALPVGEPIIHELERGELGMLAAVTNVGKSSLLRNLAICLATGKPFLPIVGEGPPRKILLLDFETRKVRLQRDIRRMAAQLGPEKKKLLRENLAVICDTRIEDEPLCLSDQRHLDYVRMNAAAFGADLLMVDTVAAAFSIREENSNAEVNSRILKPLAGLARDVGAALMIAHHIGKSGSEEGKSAEKAYRARGASSFGAWAALVLNLVQDASDPDRVTLSLAKVKGERFDDVNLRLDRESRWFELVGQPANDAPTSYRVVVDLFADGREMKTASVLAALAGQVAERTIKECLARGVGKGDLECPKRGIYRKVHVVQTPIGTAQSALSASGH
jgi:hypothetical protein